MLRSASLGLGLASFLVACSPALDPPFTRSCRGEYVNECRPYTYATITAAELTPPQITLDDPSMRAHVHVEFTRCPGSTMPTSIQLAAFAGGSGDGSIPSPTDGGSGSDARVIPLTTIPVPDTSASSLDVTIDNPFFANVPANRTIQLQFTTIIDGCEGELFATDYRTGGLAPTP
jgi:hypothetical protein